MNRNRILDAARAEFAAKGFRGATLRSIAATADVDVALIAHYFGNKQGLFGEVMQLPTGAADAILKALSGPADSWATALSRAYLGLWEDEATGSQMVALARTVLSDKHGRQGAERLLLGVVAAPEMAALLDGRRVGFTLAMGHLMGVAIQRHLLAGSPASQLGLEALEARVSPAVDLHLRTPDDTQRTGEKETR